MCLDDYVELTEAEENMYYKSVSMTITQYEKETDKELGTYTGTFDGILSQIQDYSSYYYRLTYFGHDNSHEKVFGTHFNAKVSSYGSLKFEESVQLNRLLNEYIMDSSKGYIWEHDPFLLLRNRAQWYECAIEKQLSVDKIHFQSSIEGFIDFYKAFVPIKDLSVIAKKKGLYLLVLDDYRTAYIGQSKDMKSRILSHWSTNTYWSGTGIDLFKAFDTTRIYAYVMNDEQYEQVNLHENVAVLSMDPKYLLNCVPGGGITEIVATLNENSFEETEEFLLETLVQENKWIRRNWNKFCI